jgi:hypothetical protein
MLIIPTIANNTTPLIEPDIRGFVDLRRKDVPFKIYFQPLPEHLFYVRSCTKSIQIASNSESEAMDVLPRMFMSNFLLS